MLKVCTPRLGARTLKPSKMRRQITWEAARLIHQEQHLPHSDARRLAAERLCPDGVRPHDLPDDLEIAQQLEALAKAHISTTWDDRFDHYGELLRPLAEVKQDPSKHPEGDALYHSLQVFAHARERLPYDEELITAALLHDVGKAIERRDHVRAALTALDGLVTQRTGWLIEYLPSAHAATNGTLGARARGRLHAAPDYDELVLLAECDLAGRQRGVKVPEVEEALQHLEEMSQGDTHDAPG